ncbi:hypothetical protein ACL03H_17465 [Saccharopolyspora sp. MS10]|uniref:hypothetical protein n=1 Tax=Saccharopolyspora sp. MS10 TaxID=3385973 RepID=UPI0039A0A129
MSNTPELDQVADARRRIADHARFPAAYWVLYGAALVVFAGVPIWLSWFTAPTTPYLSWVIAALGIGSALYSWYRRRRSGVYLPKRISAYPSARPIWLAGHGVTLAGFAGIWALVRQDQHPYAFAVLAVVVVVVFVAQIKTRSAMVRDIEAGRAQP